MHREREPDRVGDSELVLATGRVRVGRFRCSLSHPRFNDTGPTNAHLVVFPRTAVRITHAGGRPMVADPTRVMLYNRGQEYRRAALSPDGDRCDWFAFEGADVAQAVAHASPKALKDEERPLPVACGPTDARLYWLQRRVFEEAARPHPDLLFVEEGALLLLDRAVGAAVRAETAGASREVDLARAERVAAVQHVLSTRFEERLTLARLARIAGCSEFHLARIFRARTGLTVHAYLTQLRLRASIERLRPGADLSALALDLGFSSHSHFTRAFRLAFGAPPSALRRARS